MGKLEWRTLLARRAPNRQQYTHAGAPPHRLLSNIVDMHTCFELRYLCTDTCPRTHVCQGTQRAKHSTALGKSHTLPHKHKYIQMLCVFSLIYIQIGYKIKKDRY
ncbi:hypothetical protein GOODEAATRI_030851 [Goodea atripinnis]|uniref:Uncharacterized protein n=1 Tax=Goodea atripinnis TaxID=208336 RepID=A0ABV0NZ27_9TELE